MAHPAPLARPVEPPRLANPILDEDRIGFDAWLLPPLTPDPVEWTIRRCSVVAGPVALVAALAWFVVRIV